LSHLNFAAKRTREGMNEPVVPASPPAGTGEGGCLTVHDRQFRASGAPESLRASRLPPASQPAVGGQPPGASQPTSSRRPTAWRSPTQLCPGRCSLEVRPTRDHKQSLCLPAAAASPPSTQPNKDLLKQPLSTCFDSLRPKHPPLL
jgi:hypothetical protein